MVTRMTRRQGLYLRGFRNLELMSWCSVPGWLTVYGKNFRVLSVTGTVRHFSILGHPVIHQDDCPCHCCDPLSWSSCWQLLRFPKGKSLYVQLLSLNHQASPLPLPSVCFLCAPRPGPTLHSQKWLFYLGQHPGSCDGVHGPTGPMGGGHF